MAAEQAAVPRRHHPAARGVGRQIAAAGFRHGRRRALHAGVQPARTWWCWWTRTGSRAGATRSRSSAATRCCWTTASNTGSCAGRRHDIVLVDCQQPFGNEHLLPRGTLREPPVAPGPRQHHLHHQERRQHRAELRGRIAQFNPDAAHHRMRASSALFRGRVHRRAARPGRW